MNENTSWRGAPHHQESWRNDDIPLPPTDRQSLPSLMDPPDVVENRKTIDELRQKITDSEHNLQAHRNGMDAMLAIHLKSAIRTAETAKIEKLIADHNLNMEEFNQFLESMTTSKCSKDMISHAKRWIFDNCVNDQLREIILTYLLNKVKDEAVGEYLRLHILYLINDWAFHCQRKKEENQMKMLARYVPKMYAYCIELSSSNELSDKLEGKLLGEWEGRGYFADSVFKQLRNTVQIVSNDREIEKSSYGIVREQLRSNLVATFEAYEQQHLTYSKHIRNQIDELERRNEELRHGSSHHLLHPPQRGPPSMSSQNLRRSRFDQAPQRSPPTHSSHSSFNEQKQAWRSVDGGHSQAHSAPNIVEDDIDGTPFDENVLKPKKSYLALPAGIMVPLVSMDSFKYEPLNPDDLEMPPIVPPSQRLLNAEAFFYKGIEYDMLPVESVPPDCEYYKLPEWLDTKSQAKRDYLNRKRASLDDLIINKPGTSERERLEKETKWKENEQIAAYRDSVDAYYTFAFEESTKRKKRLSPQVVVQKPETEQSESQKQKKENAILIVLVKFSRDW
ncbi:unnamed protein product [Caenorhabditis sp. 36 PRJEB53466]|nr:unnamed protein product [Caenorhabditis sp. 36 PRJEB53466]